MISKLGCKRTAISFDELISLKTNYGISIAALVHRAKDLNIINTEYYNLIYDKYIHNNILEDGWGTYPIKEQTDRFERLLKRAALEQVISMSRAAELVNDNLGNYRYKLSII